MQHHRQNTGWLTIFVCSPRKYPLSGACAALEMRQVSAEECLGQQSIYYYTLLDPESSARPVAAP